MSRIRPEDQVEIISNEKGGLTVTFPLRESLHSEEPILITFSTTKGKVDEAIRKKLAVKISKFLETFLPINLEE